MKTFKKGDKIILIHGIDYDGETSFPPIHGNIYEIIEQDTNDMYTIKGKIYNLYTQKIQILKNSYFIKYFQLYKPYILKQILEEDV